jgi:hypothetical protein
MKKKTMTMYAVFHKLPKGYWRDAQGVTKSLESMDIDYLKKVNKFLQFKRKSLAFMQEHVDMFYDNRYNKPNDWEYILKILEVNAELKRKQGDKLESK